MRNRHSGINQFANWKNFPWLGMDSVTDAYVADATYFHFSDATHVDIWHPQKGSVDLTVQSVAMQFNASGWNGSASYISGSQFRGDAFAPNLAGSDKPFSIAWEFRPTTCPAVSFLFWANESTSSSKFHCLKYNGTGANFSVSRGDGTTTKTGSTVTMSLGNPHVLVHVFNGTTGTTRLDGVVVDNAADLDVGFISFSRWALSEAVTTGVTGVSVNAMRSMLYGDGRVWSATEIAIIESALRSSAGV